MGLIYRYIDMVAQLFLFISLLFFLPPLYLFKFINFSLSSRFPEDLTNKVVLIVGASSGIGEHLAYEYAKRGALLVLVARRKNSLQDVAKMARDFGSPSVLAVPADFTKPDECQRFVDATIQNFGRRKFVLSHFYFFAQLFKLEAYAMKFIALGIESQSCDSNKCMSMNDAQSVREELL